MSELNLFLLLVLILHLFNKNKAGYIFFCILTCPQTQKCSQYHLRFRKLPLKLYPEFRLKKKKVNIQSRDRNPYKKSNKNGRQYMSAKVSHCRQEKKIHRWVTCPLLSPGHSTVLTFAVSWETNRIMANIVYCNSSDWHTEK